jgi:hypothetical protein
MVSSCGVGSVVLLRPVRCLTRTGHSGSFALWATPQAAHLKGGWIQAPPAWQLGIGQEWSHMACCWVYTAQVGLSALHSFVWCP